MIGSVTGLTRNGVKDFWVQRISAIILAVYVLFLLGFLISHSPVNFAIWKNLFVCTWMRIFSLLALLSLLGHAWIGVWTIFTDYVTCAVLRGILQIAVVIVLFFCLLWGIHILWWG